MGEGERWEEDGEGKEGEIGVSDTGEGEEVGERRRERVNAFDMELSFSK